MKTTEPNQTHPERSTKIMKSSLIIFTLIIPFLFAQSNFPEELIEIVKSPPPISIGMPIGHHIAAAKGALIETENIICYIELTGDDSSLESSYRFRSFSKKYNIEVSGSGVVREKKL